MNKDPLVSVIIPTLNRVSLRPAINSVSAQSYSKIEIVIVDDNSTTPVDQSALQEVAGRCPVHVIRNVTRLGGAAARNVGVAHAHGEYIAFLDDDDTYLQNKIDVLLRTIMSQQADAAFGKTVLHENRDAWSFTYPPNLTPMTNFYLFNIIHNNATLIHKDVFQHVRFLPTLPRFQDMQFNTELFLRAKVAFVDEFVATWDISEREDKITSRGDLAKKARDAAALQELIKHYHATLGNEFNRPMAAYYLKLCKMFFDAGMPLDALSAFTKATFPPQNILHIRNTMTLLRNYRKRLAVM